MAPVGVPEAAVEEEADTVVAAGLTGPRVFACPSERSGKLWTQRTWLRAGSVGEMAAATEGPLNVFMKRNDSIEKDGRHDVG